MKNKQIARVPVLFALPAWLSAAESRPNIVFILTDDLGDGVAFASGAWAADQAPGQSTYEQLVEGRIQEGLESMADRRPPFKGVVWDLRHASRWDRRRISKTTYDFPYTSQK